MHKQYTEFWQSIKNYRGHKIRVIAMQTSWRHDQAGYHEITSAVNEAKAAGIFAISSSLAETYGLHFHGLGREPLADPNQFESYIPYLAGMYVLAAQVKPDIAPEEFWVTALKTGKTIQVMHEGKQYSFGVILDPQALISALQK